MIKTVNNLKKEEKTYCLLIGNSRWHWASKEKTQWEFFHTLPKSEILESPIDKWAAVGNIPNHIALKSEDEIQIKNIPLLNLPDWLGIDRALGGWNAFQKAKQMGAHKKGVLVADAGTVLSLTCITANGEFGGGQLIPGFNLQMSLMANQTKNLKNPLNKYLPISKFPISTNDAMLRGSFQSLIGTILEAQKDAEMPLWLCGGDSEILCDDLIQRKVELNHYPNLVLEGLVNLKKN
tara:strand:- start:1005 stop:1712 length:708 start_codon:yes stop_codon:yes gene_type:complete